MSEKINEIYDFSRNRDGIRFLEEKSVISDIQICVGIDSKKHSSYEMSVNKRKDSTDGYAWCCSKCFPNIREIFKFP